MRERARFKALSGIRRLQTAELEIARLDQARAEAVEAEALAHAVKAEADALHAFTSWENALDGPRFDPDHTRRLSADLTSKESALALARDGLQSAREQTLSTRTAHARRAAAIEQTDEIFADVRRSLARKSEEAAMATLEERVTFQWGMP